MATLVLSAAGAAIGGSIGGAVLGLSMTAVGRFAGAAIGRAIDQRLLGQGAEPVDTPRLDRLRISSTGEGTPVPQVYGRVRVPGHVIWTSRFRETVATEGGGGGKGAPRRPEIRHYSYTVSLALALCEGEIAAVNRVWADGQELSVFDLGLRVYHGTPDQGPDPRIEAEEGAGQVPAYRGLAYVVIEDLALAPFGNRVPQFSFEVVRNDFSDADTLADLVRGVAMIPGSGDYVLATEKVYLPSGGDRWTAANVNTPSNRSDFATSLDQLRDELPNCRAVSVIQCWFGNDLRCGSCEIRPKVEQQEADSPEMPWEVAGLTRWSAEAVPRLDGRPVYGGTPGDQSVVQAIKRLQDAGMWVMFYPFILMDQLPGNGLPDPYGARSEQADLPWRGRITLSVAPGLPGSPDGSAAADREIEDFFGTARASDFQVSADGVTYSGPDEWRYRRFILHQAALCAQAGGVDAFCIGSEMRGLTTLRGQYGFAAVAALRDLAADCRAILGPDVKIGYAADWSEYFGHHPQDGTGDVYFHLDPLWADDTIDFIGIDNYMPLSDWRDSADHADSATGSLYDLDYLKANIEGCEGYDWYYPDPAARSEQARTPITDGAHGEPWVWRYKDIRNWWENRHHERIGGVRQAVPTVWEPRSKPIWFTEFGCAAIDKGTNQPNKFLDPKSSESRLPHHSNGLRDDLIQNAYIRAMCQYWSDMDNNPVSPVYGGRMLDMDRAFVWAWDARPYPWFPSNEGLWSDGDNYQRGHWLNGRAGGVPLADVVASICARAGLTEIDVSQLHGFVRGYHVRDIGSARSALQPLMLAYGFDAVERDGQVVFRSRAQARAVDLSAPPYVMSGETEGAPAVTRQSEGDLPGRVRLAFVLSDGDHDIATEEAVLPDGDTHAFAQNDVALSLTRPEARQIAERWLAETRTARDTLRFALPLSRIDIGCGDVVRLPASDGACLARIDRVDLMDHLVVDAVRIRDEDYRPASIDDAPVPLIPPTPAVPVTAQWLDLPVVTGEEGSYAPHIAITADPWPGEIAVYASPEDGNYRLDQVVAARAVMGETLTPLGIAPAGMVDRGAPLLVSLYHGALESISHDAFLTGGNAMAIGSGDPQHWEVFQFRDAHLVGPGQWALGHRLRGQAGTDGVMPQTWPAGSRVVLLNGAVAQAGLPAAVRNQTRHMRIGPAHLPYDDPVYRHQSHVFAGIGLRPYRPAHLRLQAQDGNLSLTWVRRTRVDGDDWTGPDVPLGEEQERYLLRIRTGQSLLREVHVQDPFWTYTAADRAQDGAVGTLRFQVAQVSARFGPGPFAECEVEL